MMQWAGCSVNKSHLLSIKKKRIHLGAVMTQSQNQVNGAATLSRSQNEPVSVY